jgi:hypothetical protein
MYVALYAKGSLSLCCIHVVALSRLLVLFFMVYLMILSVIHTLIISKSRWGSKYMAVWSLEVSFHIKFLSKFYKYQDTYMPRGGRMREGSSSDLLYVVSISKFLDWIIFFILIDIAFGSCSRQSPSKYLCFFNSLHPVVL